MWVLAGCATVVSPAAAQGVVGKFKLPYQVRWGHTLLPPGEYNYSVEPLGVHPIPASGPVLVTVRRAEGGSATLLLAMASQLVEESDGNGLTFLVENGERTLCSLSVNNLGIVVRFKMPEMSAKKPASVTSAKASY